ncbi:endo alpha-1,4 polygalactosaminidase [Atopomonas sediminilitoris]|uniref:endo alpha-1,4 polygalactosaminidase n=1 Tax=Atopomonas sediminilitoris TaxID=2919919 RepID=UPI001F4E8089|nr:endo alpha-1,4 polygalactosaminidase [Atopomonas sediminilitoris]MCJ8169023.1 endo alpha-1,4 polygalactosaminidase [Atopomonas sediminilitoris]
MRRLTQHWFSKPLTAIHIALGMLLVSACTASPITIPASSSWHWQLSGNLQMPNRHVYDIDLYDTPSSTIGNLKAQGRIVVCYFSAGSWEDWRDDAAQYPTQALGNNLDGWPGERWLDIRNSTVRTLLAKRMDLAVSKGCDAVEPDNVDGYSNSNGLGLTKADQLDFNRWLASAAHARNLAIALKNAVELVPDLVNHFDFALNESCYRYNECNAYNAFTAQGKAVFVAEYRKYNNKLCNKANASGFQLQYFKRALNTVGKPCT